MKLLRVILILAVTVCLLTVTACNGGTPEDTTSENTAATTEAPSEETAETPADTKVEVTLSVQDQDKNPISEAVISILPVIEGGESATLSVDNNGTVTVTLPEGEYTVRFDVLPEYVLGIDTPLTVAAGMEPVALEVTDNTPNGSEERPFVLAESGLTVSIPAGTTYHFTLFGANNRTLSVENANAAITYKDTVYTPDESGKVEVRMSTESQREHAYFALTNQGTEAADFTVNIFSDPGAMDNPIVIEALGEAITANVPQDGMVYYSWTATAAGTLTVTSADTINNISLNNLATSKVTDFSGGAESVSMTVAEGDTITVVVSVIGGDRQAETNPVTFTLTLGE